MSGWYALLILCYFCRSIFKWSSFSCNTSDNLTASKTFSTNYTRFKYFLALITYVTAQFIFLQILLKHLNVGQSLTPRTRNRRDMAEILTVRKIILVKIWIQLNISEVWPLQLYIVTGLREEYIRNKNSSI